MYESFFGLHDRPFSLSTDPKYFCLTESHREVLGSLRYALTGCGGLMLLVGEAGTGKTTVIRAALQASGPDTPGRVYVGNTTLTRSEFYELLTHRFELSPAAAHSKAAFLIEFERRLAAIRAEGGRPVLIVDEAQALSDEVLEEIRLLANANAFHPGLLTVILAGQPELTTRLNLPSLRQLKQRIALRCTLRPLTLDETAAYISTRVRLAGGRAPDLFAHDVVPLIHRASAGIARTITVICDNALLTAFASGQRRVERAVVSEVCRNLEVHLEAASPPSPGKPAVDGAGHVRSRPPALARAGDGQGSVADVPPAAADDPAAPAGAATAPAERPAEYLAIYARERRFLPFFRSRRETA